MSKQSAEFADQLILLMQAANYSAMELAVKLKTHPSYVSRILNGNANLTFKTANRFASALNGSITITFK